MSNAKRIAINVAAILHEFLTMAGIGRSRHLEGLGLAMLLKRHTCESDGRYRARMMDVLIQRIETFDDLLDADTCGDRWN